VIAHAMLAQHLRRKNQSSNEACRKRGAQCLSVEMLLPNQPQTAEVLRFFEREFSLVSDCPERGCKKPARNGGRHPTNKNSPLKKSQRVAFKHRDLSGTRSRQPAGPIFQRADTSAGKRKRLDAVWRRVGLACDARSGETDSVGWKSPAADLLDSRDRQFVAVRSAVMGC